MKKKLLIILALFIVIGLSGCIELSMGDDTSLMLRVKDDGAITEIYDSSKDLNSKVFDDVDDMVRDDDKTYVISEGFLSSGESKNLYKIGFASDSALKNAKTPLLELCGLTTNARGPPLVVPGSSQGFVFPIPTRPW